MLPDISDIILYFALSPFLLLLRGTGWQWRLDRNLQGLNDVWRWNCSLQWEQGEGRGNAREVEECLGKEKNGLYWAAWVNERDPSETVRLQEAEIKKEISLQSNRECRKEVKKRVQAHRMGVGKCQVWEKRLNPLQAKWSGFCNC